MVKKTLEKEAKENQRDNEESDDEERIDYLRDLKSKT